MEAALVSAATGALKPVMRKLAALMGDEYKHLKEVQGDIRFVTDELTAMHAFLLKMSEEEEPDEQDKVWMTAVRELSYDMEDSINDFMQCVDDKNTKIDGFIEKIKNSLRKLGKAKDRRQIGFDIQDLKRQIIVVSSRNERYKTPQAVLKTINFSNNKIEVVDPRALAIFERASKLVGIDEPKSELMELLTEEDGRASTEQQLKMVSIVGSGGMGKTTLANQVYQEIKEKFKCIL
ncbi:unnamed protein product [Triticum turgidum subsp. durum]|uniref:Rx N-terminal domain-containing protein n=1 Tax=Triticum turgidum subsp. durum TaxID=4567 RepID=A0A9R1BGG2_TRITD|nr:unnamed protein product [Triticum turgidum subsp. durum]